MVPAGTYRARLEYYPEVPTRIARSAPFQTGAAAAVPTLSELGLAVLVLTLAGKHIRDPASGPDTGGSRSAVCRP